MMLPRQAGVTAFVFTVLAVAGLTSATSAGDVRTLPMQFELVQEGPASTCGNKCRTFISAVGAITKDTPSDFAAFTRDRNVTGATLVLDSSGGSTLGTLSLGRNIRRLGINTTVGKLTRLPSGSGVALSPRADCESMCAYLLLSGKQRFVPAEAKVLVHEIWLGDRREDAAAASYSAEDVMIVQRDIGKLAQYTIEMGGSIDLLETSLRIPPWEPMRRLQPAELRSMGLDTSAIATSAQNTESAPVAATTSSQPMPRVPPSERGWIMNGKAGQASLRRRHPLTVEGDELGSFDITLSCAGKDGYDVTYAERRRNERLGEPLKNVEISIGRRTVALKIITSEIKETELASLARGVLPASVVESLSKQGSRSVTVTTSSGNDVATTTRVGNSGVPQNFPQLAASCAEQQQQVARSNTHAELAPAKAVEAGIATAK